MKKVDVVKKILHANEKYALDNVLFLTEHKKLCLNMIYVIQLTVKLHLG